MYRNNDDDEESKGGGANVSRNYAIDSSVKNQGSSLSIAWDRSGILYLFCVSIIIILFIPFIDDFSPVALREFFLCIQTN